VIRAELVLLGLTLSLTACATKLTVRDSVPTTPDNNARPLLHTGPPAGAAESAITVGFGTFTPGRYADTKFAKQHYAPETLEMKPSAGYFIPGGAISSPKASVEVADTRVETEIAALSAAVHPDVASADACLDWTGRDLEACRVYGKITSLKTARTELVSGKVTLPLLTGDIFDKVLKVLNDDIDCQENRYFKGSQTSQTFDFSSPAIAEATSKTSTDSQNPAKDTRMSGGCRIDQ
jgi:hypothetical protein